jgi:hypothetical protein
MAATLELAARPRAFAAASRCGALVCYKPLAVDVEASRRRLRTRADTIGRNLVGAS